MPWVDPRDIGDVVAARLLSTDWAGHQVQAVHGPADLSYNDVADILSDACGRRISVQVESDERPGKVCWWPACRRRRRPVWWP